MYLKALEIQGFKSFADKTVLTFDHNITAIVGPNGSGKSNISDALLWVMGEQRTRALRGAKMEDVIFGGTQKRSPLGFAQVSLILDNSARIFDYDSDEVVLGRRYYRSGESEYYINRESVRLKDIQSLLMDTGLGRDGYSIIGQGRIAEIVSTRSTDRREVFEEAAGISRFRFRKEEAEHKLEKTDENLTRVNDKIDELEMQVEPLRKQSETAKKYLALRDQLKEKEISVWMENLDQVRQRSEHLRIELEQAETALAQARAGVDALHVSSDSITERMHEKDIQADDIRRRVSEAELRKADKEAEAAVLRSNIRNAEDSKQRFLDDIAGQETRTAEVRASIASYRERIEELEKNLSDLREQAERCGNAVEGNRMKQKSREAAVNDLTERVNALSVENRSIAANISMLERMEKEYEGYGKAVKTVMREAERGTIRGVFGPAGNLLHTDSECALAIETALGAAAQNIVIDTQNNGRLAIEMLKRMDAGRATFLPVDTIRGSVMKDAPVNDPGFVGIAYELIDTEPQYEQIFKNLLGRTVVAEDLSAAVRMSRNNGNRLRIVTLDGQQINAGGSMTGGSVVKGSGILSRANDLQKLYRKKEKQEKEQADQEDRLTKARAELSSIRYQLDMALEDQRSVSSQISSAEAEERSSRSTIAQFNILLESLTGDSERRRDDIEAADNQILSLQQQLAHKEEQIAQDAEQINGIRAELEEVAKARLELEGRRTQTERETQKRNDEVNELTRTSERLGQRREAAELEVKQYKDKLWDTYELSYTAAAQLRKPIENLQNASKEVAGIRRAMSALGNPNLGSIEEYERVNTRYTFLTDQRADVLKARGELLDIINDITEEMKKVFTEQFHAIDTCFRQTFLELFGGGRAALVLENEEDVLNCGIEIKAQPPGKSLTNISLMSGGEKAFVAIALYFAILKVRPTPFCVMDEIEAALDEANVDRFAAYMRRMSDKTQFITITHRRGTMEEADALYGVTMMERGVSTVLDIDLNEAEQHISAR